MSFLSNKISERVYYPNPDENKDVFFDYICDYVKKKRIEFIFPVRDSSTEIFSKRKLELPSGCRVYLPEFDKIELLNNKASLMKLAKKLNILHPKTIFLKNKNYNINKLGKLGFPLIAKPISSSGSRGIIFIKNKESLEIFLCNNQIDKSFYILQEFIPHGGAIGYHSLCESGSVKSRNVHVRLREYPHTGGPSTLRRSGKNALVEHLSKKILREVFWTGVSMVEFRIHRDNKLPYLMEVNTRFWGSLSVDHHSGIDFPSDIINLEAGRKIEPKKPKKVLVRWLFLGDILWLLTHPKKISALKKFLDFREQKFDIFSGSDPLPVVGTIIEGLIGLTQKDRREHAFVRGWNGEVDNN